MISDLKKFFDFHKVNSVNKGLLNIEILDENIAVPIENIIAKRVALFLIYAFIRYHYNDALYEDAFLQEYGFDFRA